MDLRLSTKAEYGLKAMIDIASQGGDKPVQVIDIARRQGIARESLAVLMIDLKRAGLVASVRGPTGGYLLTRDSEHISVRQIIEALEGPIGSAFKQKEPRYGAGAAIHETWRNCLMTLIDTLENTSLDSLAKLSYSSALKANQSKASEDVPEGYVFNI
ncbi:MAG TPA: Rrf2 family transcriptional regulator [Blastocatellia bacterium]|nr:Rrf2 family transcriptional regulator [Blastocatellia bacterium]